MTDILLVEDSETMSIAYMGYLQKGGYAVRHVSTGAAAMAALRESQPRAVILDIQLPDISGIEVLKELQSSAPDVPSIIITAHGTVEKAVAAMRLGAYDFIMKPFPAERLLVTLKNALDRNLLRHELQELQAEKNEHGFGPFIGTSLPMQAVYRTLKHVAGSKVPVFITGESGTGKELAAQALHSNGPRRAGPFRAINCAAIPENLLESELFGYTKGAFTGASSDRLGVIPAADGGTLFLDEVCDMSLELQAKLLRVLQTSQVTPVGSNKDVNVDVRFVAATNRDPAIEVRNGRFREDLYYRLFVVPVELPRLAERGADIALLAGFFLQRYAKEEKKDFTGFAPSALQFLQTYNWPGNVRQLENAIRYVVATRPGGEVLRDQLPPQLLEGSAHPITGQYHEMAPGHSHSAAVPLAQIEREAIEAALRQTGDDVSKAAALLEINPSTIYRKLQAWEKSAKHAS